MIALGAPMDAAISPVLADIRPHLSPTLQRLPDDKLLALVNWNIMTAWNSAIRLVGNRPTGPNKRGWR